MGKLDKARTFIATLDLYLRTHPYKSSSAIYALATFSTAGVFATQLSHAPLDPKHDPPSVPRNTPQLMYMIPPAMTVIVPLLEIYILSGGYLGKHTRVAQFGLGGFMMVGWVVTTALWGHCHLEAQDEVGSAWPKVCYQYNLKFEGHGYVERVNHRLGDAVVAMGAIMVVFYAGFAWKIAKDRGASPDDLEVGGRQSGSIPMVSVQAAPVQVAPNNAVGPSGAFKEEFWGGGGSSRSSPKPASSGTVGELAAGAPTT